MSTGTKFLILCVFSLLLVTEGQRRRRRDCPRGVTGQCISEELCSALNHKVYGHATMVVTKRCKPGKNGEQRVCCERFPECKEVASGIGYRGRLNSSESGKPCLPWQFPDHFFSGGETTAEAGNFCRSLDYVGPGTDACRFSDLACFTANGIDGFEFCSLPLCSELRNQTSPTTAEAEECKRTSMGKEYRGHRNTTVSGRICQRWYRDIPHKVKGAALLSENYPDETIHAARNYCRNPDGDAKGPWCYTTDEEVKWEYCDVPFCPGASGTEVKTMETFPATRTVVQETSTECIPDQYGRGYRGKRNSTVSGRACRRWDDPEKNDDSYFSDEDDTWENFCRSPAYRQREGVWCYTTDPDVIWEYCDVPQCPTDDCKTSVCGEEYQGFRNTTRSGKSCVRWDDERLKGEFMFSDWMQRAEANNYCRNFPPNYDVMPWCMIQNEFGDLQEEYCAVPLCSDKIENITKDFERDFQELMTRNLIDCSGHKDFIKYNFGGLAAISLCWTPIGGSETKVFEYPFLALIGRKRSGPLASLGSWDFFCGGTLISADFIITAAHCFVDGVPEIVRLREHDIRGDVEGEPLPIDTPVAQLIIHPNYKAPSFENDIALIRLENKLTAFDETVRPACLPRLRQPLHPGTLVKAIGWGTVGFSAAKTPVPIEVDFPVWDSLNCSAHYANRKEVYPRGLPIGKVICAGAPGKDKVGGLRHWKSNSRAPASDQSPSLLLPGGHFLSGKDTCQGDSGGPLLLDRLQTNTVSIDRTAGSVTLQYELAGITSGGFACGTLLPGVYTRIESYLEWILQSIVEARKV
ncbi:unnamed protein product [Cyprideis torosa]|uniref:Plasmin n=1 Tax=Cyprideis torosa TaxID=163714 RepID=A0A7R8WKK0_9CRUS|nr:unnamed protein product [Cyprideis torosa]CAG0896962.1 unnamed protein product [Cyprideis torosa]